ncbi:MAG: 16S rRNA (uracil(1498)-N(3))-methyltransferase [Nocardioidaceae bacterium]|nr:16S rRNA (uracil(1498)-N(3))-methyltransferase [Nocardioidaceae bacterium]
MTLPVFVVGAEALQRDRVELGGDEGRHAVVVKRLRLGERVTLTDAQGAGADCEVVEVSRRGLVAQVLVRRSEAVAVPALTVVQAIPKGEHAERAVDLLTEIGVDTIVPWAASRNIVSWRGEREANALGRWRATAQAAAKQSRRLRFPEVTALHTTSEVAELVEAADLALVLHEGAVGRLGEFVLPQSGVVVLVVGPEGGITDDELASFAARGGRPARLGPFVLRSSTAGVVGATAVLSRTPRWT